VVAAEHYIEQVMVGNKLGILIPRAEFLLRQLPQNKGVSPAGSVVYLRWLVTSF